MFCPSCGKELSEGSHFCPACGKETAPASAPVKPASTVTLNTKTLLVIAAAVIVVLLAVLDAGWRTPDIAEPGVTPIGTEKMGELICQAL